MREEDTYRIKAMTEFALTALCRLEAYFVLFQSVDQFSLFYYLAIAHS
jgi:hypothetical protein